MSDIKLDTISAPELKAGLFGGGYIGALGLIENLINGAFNPELLNLPLLAISLFAVIVGLPQKHIISLLRRDKQFAIKTGVIWLLSLWVFVYFNHPLMKIFAAASSALIFFSSFRYKSTDM